jgi:hypothetical protein
MLLSLLCFFEAKTTGHKEAQSTQLMNSRSRSVLASAARACGNAELRNSGREFSGERA